MARKRRDPPPAPKPQDVEAWLRQHPEKMVHCPYQPGELVLSKAACAKRHMRANDPKYANIGAESFSLFVIKMNLIPCRECEIGARLAHSLFPEAA